MLILDPYSDDVGRRVGFIVKSRCGLEGTVGLEGEEMVVVLPSQERIGQYGSGIRIGGVELADDRPDRLVLRNGQGSGRVQIGG